MEKEILIKYLENEDDNYATKYRYVDSLNLNYSTLFELLDYFNGTEVHKLLLPFVMCDSPVLINKMKQRYREEKGKRKKVKIRRNFYGKY